MSNLAKAFKRLSSEKRKGLIVYLTAGFPDYKTTVEAALAAEAAGADIIELGMPFSDPMADGPVIQRAADAAIKNGATTAGSLKAIAAIRQKSNIPLAVMTYYNTVLQYGVADFTANFAAAGAEGLVIPDLPVEESIVVAPSCSCCGLELIQFVAPTSTADRIAAICTHASGFIYCVSTTGVTGVKNIDYSEIGSVINNIRAYTDVPTAIGFGIGSPEAAREASRHGDAVIIGSAIVERLWSGGIKAMADFVADVRQALDEER